MIHSKLYSSVSHILLQFPQPGLNAVFYHILSAFSSPSKLAKFADSINLFFQERTTPYPKAAKMKIDSFSVCLKHGLSTCMLKTSLYFVYYWFISVIRR